MCNQNGHGLPITLPLEYSDFEWVTTKMGCDEDGDGADGGRSVEIFWGEHPALINESSRNNTVLVPSCAVGVGTGCSSHIQLFYGKGVGEERHGQKRKCL